MKQSMSCKFRQTTAQDSTPKCLPNKNSRCFPKITKFQRKVYLFLSQPSVCSGQQEEKEFFLEKKKKKQTACSSVFGKFSWRKTQPFISLAVFFVRKQLNLEFYECVTPTFGKPLISPFLIFIDNGQRFLQKKKSRKKKPRKTEIEKLLPNVLFLFLTFLNSFSSGLLCQ